MRAPALLFVAVLAGVPAPARAGQIVDPATGSLVGIVRDASGAVVPDVGITVSGPALMTPRQTSTDAAGAYRILRLPPGDYSVSFARQGFAVTEHTVRVGLGFTADLDVTLSLDAQRAEVAVTAASSVLDRHSAASADTFDSKELDALPSSRSMAGVIGLAHGLYMPSVEVGAGLGLQAGSFSAYGRNSSPRHTIEGIVVTGLFGAGFSPDYGALEELAVLTAAHGAEWPTAGIHTQLVTKSGGNRYAGSIYSGYENRHWQSSNVDTSQIGRFAPSGGGLSAGQANQVWSYRDVNADAGGFVVRDRLWWYSSIRDQEIATRLVNFPVEPHRTQLTNYSGKVTARAAPGHTVVAYGQRGLNDQPYHLDPFGPPGGALSEATAVNESIESTARQRNASWLWKGEWDAVFNDSLLFDLRAGQFANELDFEPRSTAPRFEDIETLLVSGGSRDTHTSTRRNQLFGSMNYFTDGAGSHHLKAGGEAIRFLVHDSWLSAAPGNVLHVMQGGSPSSVLLFATPSYSEAGIWTYSAYVSDSWRLKNRLTLTLGLRFDRYRVFLPAQAHPESGQQFDAVPNLIDWNTLIPRIAAVYDLSGRGTTLAKFSFARYRGAPNAATGFNSNPNAAIWWRQHQWSDPDGSGRWEPGEEETAPQARRGGVAVESLDPAMRLPVLDEAGTWIERELPGRVGIRAGVVWRRERSQFARQNLNRPFDAFNVPVQIRDPGPDGEDGTADDGATVTAYDLRPDFVGLRASNVLTNVANSTRSMYWTWEVSATRRRQGRWSLGAGVTHTWNRDHASGYHGQLVRNNPYVFTPNDLIHTGEGGAHEFRTWTAKAHGTYDAPWDLHITPVLRHQSGQPFGRTFTGQLRNANATVTLLAEPVGTRRLDNITLLDVRVEKRVRLPRGLRLAASLDVFNALNANPEQNLIWSSGPSYFRPLSIVSPRVAKVGLSFDW